MLLIWNSSNSEKAFNLFELKKNCLENKMSYYEKKTNENTKKWNPLFFCVCIKKIVKVNILKNMVNNLYMLKIGL